MRPSAPPRPTKERPNLTVRKIVIVDDDATVVSALEELLKTWGYEVVAFGSFEEARALLLVHAPDALIADVRLGMFNGLQLIYIARQQRPDMKAMIMSGFDDTDLRAEAARAGAVYVVKPVNFDQLGQWLAADPPPRSDDATPPSYGPGVEGAHTRHAS